MQTYEDAQAILVDCAQIQNHLIAQDARSPPAAALGAEEQEVLAEPGAARGGAPDE